MSTLELFPSLSEPNFCVRYPFLRHSLLLAHYGHCHSLYAASHAPKGQLEFIYRQLLSYSDHWRGGGIEWPGTSNNRVSIKFGTHQSVPFMCEAAEAGKEGRSGSQFTTLVLGSNAITCVGGIDVGGREFHGYCLLLNTEVPSNRPFCYLF